MHQAIGMHACLCLPAESLYCSTGPQGVLVGLSSAIRCWNLPLLHLWLQAAGGSQRALGAGIRAGPRCGTPAGHHHMERG